MVFKTGVYSGFGNFDSLTWNVKKLEWIGGRLEAVWSFETDWKPEPLALTAWESVLQPAISGHDIYVPGLGGTVHRVATETGISEGRVNPFADVDPTRYVAGGLGVGPDGSVFYNVIDLPNRRRGRRWRLAREGDPRGRGFARGLLDARDRRAGADVGLPGAVSERSAAVAADAGRGGPDDPVRLAAPRHQRRSGDRRGRHDLHAEPRASLGPLQLSRRRASGSDAGLEGLVSRDPGRRLRRAPPHRRHEPGLPHGRAPRGRSVGQRPAGGARPRPGDRVAGRPPRRQRPHRRVDELQLRPRPSPEVQSAGRRARDLRLRLGPHAGGVRARRHLLDPHQGQPLLGSGRHRVLRRDVARRQPRAGVVVPRDEHRELRAPAGRRDRRASTTIPRASSGA